MAHQYSHAERYEMVRCYITSGESLRGAQRLYRSDSLPRLQRRGIASIVPSRRIILAANQNLLDFGQFTTPTHAMGSGGHNQISPTFDDAVIRFFEQNPCASTREAARRFNVSQYYVWKLLNSNLYHPYHFQSVQDLHDGDGPARIRFCEWLLANNNNNILWTDEALFTRVGIYNRKNEHFWALNNPHVIKNCHHQVRFSVNVWAGIINNVIVGPVFIEGSLTGGNYLHMLQGVIEDLLDDVPLSLTGHYYYQHDGAPPHYSRLVRDYLNTRYGDMWIGRGGPVPWPARSPDLTPLDFYLWGEVKRLVYVEEAQSYDDLRNKIVSAFDVIKSQTETLNLLQNSLRKRARLCIERNGLHFEQLLKYV